MKRNSCSRRELLFLSLAAVTAGALPALAQAPTPASTPSPTSATPERKPFSPAQLDQILAPIALFRFGKPCIDEAAVHRA